MRHVISATFQQVRECNEHWSSIFAGKNMRMACEVLHFQDALMLTLPRRFMIVGDLAVLLSHNTDVSCRSVAVEVDTVRAWRSYINQSSAHKTGVSQVCGLGSQSVGQGLSKRAGKWSQ